MPGRAGAQGSPESFHVELGAMLWKPTPEVSLSSGAAGSPVDFIGQFGVERKRFRDIRVVIKPTRKQKLRYGSVPFTYSGTATLNQPITFQGRTYSVGTPVTADLKWTLMRFGYEWDPIATDMGFIGVFADVKYNKLDASLTGPAPVGTLSLVRNVPVPTVGSAARVYLSRNSSVTTEFTALKMNNRRINARFYDFDVYTTGNFGRNVGVQIGYRRLTADFVVDDDAGNIKMKGPYIGAVIRF